jgi:hypothetical protein
MEEYTLTAATWAWLLIPMPLLVLLSAISLFKGKSTNSQHSIEKGEVV